MTYEELKQKFISVPQKCSFSYIVNNQSIHLVKFPATHKVEYLYMAKPSPAKEEHLPCMRIGSELWFVGLIVKHDFLVLHDHLILLGLSDKPEVKKLEDCYGEAAKMLRDSALKMVEGKALPLLDAIQEQKAQNLAVFSLLHDETPKPDLSGLVMSCSDSELLVAYLSDMMNWIENRAKRWLDGHEHECLVNIAISNRAAEFLHQWASEPNSDAHVYKSMMDATKMRSGYVMVKYSDGIKGENSCIVRAVVFQNQYGDDYEVIPIAGNKYGKSSFVRAKGFIQRKCINMILDGSGEKILWKKDEKQ